jgi:Na+:H+ antiporter, NhaA family
MQQQLIDRWLINPVNRFIKNTTASGVVLFGSALAAILLSNSPWAEDFHHIWEHKFSVGYDQFVISKDLHHWINDGLMAIFFFVVGLELKREIIAGELSNPRKALLPIAAALFGMIVPASIYLFFNAGTPEARGWGIPMATDIAFALGILYLLGDRVPISLKVFLTALAVADDLGAVLVIALFYTSDISVQSLMVGAVFMGILIIANIVGVRNTTFYGIVGIGGLWLAFLLSGVHATIAAVLAAFTIPARSEIRDERFAEKIRMLVGDYQKASRSSSRLVSDDQLHVVEDIRAHALGALTPLQRLEHALHPLVAFVIMPVFALANAGVSFSSESLGLGNSPVTYGVALGLLLGKVLGVVGITFLLVHLKIAEMPKGMTWRHVIGLGFLASIGFTMSLFISSLAFGTSDAMTQAKLGILLASLIGGLVGYFYLKSVLKRPEERPADIGHSLPG